MKTSLIIPVENQVRELDPKLLLACIAARRGFTSIIGSRREVDFRITSLPKSLYLAKSMTIRGLKMFQIMHKLGHEIATWDEEALVHLPTDMYFSRRLSPESIKYLSHLFAWGQDNVDLWSQYPELPEEIPIHLTGNPRSDMLRPEIRGFYDKEVDEIHKTHGNFILVNTNFNHVNAFYPGQNLFQPLKKPAKEPKFGRAARGMSREYAVGFRDHKQAIFEDFQGLIPALDKTFSDYKIVVRPHPTENQEIYRKIAAQCERVRVTNEGNVVPWLLATRALIHNGCTTGVEAYVLGIPAISYRETVNDYYDYGFYRLPNLVSYQCFDFEELRITLKKILSGEMGPADGDEREALVDHHLAARSGPLACERIVDVLDEITAGQTQLSEPILRDQLHGRILANMRTLIKTIKARLPESHNRPEFQRHRYPGISLKDLRLRLSRFQQLLGDSRELEVEQLSDNIFRIRG